MEMTERTFKKRRRGRNMHAGTARRGKVGFVLSPPGSSPVKLLALMWTEISKQMKTGSEPHFSLDAHFSF
jgi:hypothetical protein